MVPTELLVVVVFLKKKVTSQSGLRYAMDWILTVPWACTMVVATLVELLDEVEVDEVVVLVVEI